MVQLQPCGTPAAYKRHLRKGEPACTDCLAANNKYSKGLRADPAFAREQIERSNARHRALRRLAQEYPDRYRQLASEELSKLTFPED